jgi:hypothetical protein
MFGKVIGTDFSLQRYLGFPLSYITAPEICDRLNKPAQLLIVENLYQISISRGGEDVDFRIQARVLRQYISPKLWYLPTSPYGVTNQKSNKAFGCIRSK